MLQTATARTLPTPAESYATSLLAAFTDADAALQRHRGDCQKMHQRDFRSALVENQLKLRVALAEDRLASEIETHGGRMTIEGRSFTVCWATLPGDRRRRRWIHVRNA